MRLLRIIVSYILFGSGLVIALILRVYLKDIMSLHALQMHQQALLHTLDSALSSSSSLPISPPPPPQPPPAAPSPPALIEDVQAPFLPMHNMTDEQLCRKASVISRIREYPFVYVPKVAFMFLTRGTVTLAPLWEMFFKGHEGLYSMCIVSLLTEEGYRESHPSMDGGYLAKSVVQWGDMNMVAAERRLLANDLLDFSNQRFVLLSEACISLFNFTTVYDYLVSSTKTFVEAYDRPSPVGRGRYNPNTSPTVMLKQWRKGSQWFEIDRDLAAEVVADQKYFPVFWQHCYDPCYGDEHYLPTYVSIDFWRKNSNRSLTWVDWSKGGPHKNPLAR